MRKKNTLLLLILMKFFSRCEFTIYASLKIIHFTIIIIVRCIYCMNGMTSCTFVMVVVLSDILLRRGFYWGRYCCMSYFNIWVITVWRYTNANFRWGRKNHEGLVGIFLFNILAGGAYFCCLIHQDTWSSNLYIHHHHNNYHRSIYQI